MVGWAEHPTEKPFNEITSYRNISLKHTIGIANELPRPNPYRRYLLEEAGLKSKHTWAHLAGAEKGRREPGATREEP